MVHRGGERRACTGYHRPAPAQPHRARLLALRRGRLRGERVRPALGVGGDPVPARLSQQIARVEASCSGAKTLFCSCEYMVPGRLPETTRVQEGHHRRLHCNAGLPYYFYTCRQRATRSLLAVQQHW